ARFCAPVEPIFLPWARHPPPSSDPADLFDVDVHQFAGPVPLVTHRGGLRRADHRAGERIEFSQIRHSMPAQDPRYRPGRHTELRADPVLSPPVLLAGGQDLVFGLRFGAGRAGVWAGGPVIQTVFAFGAIPVDPA